VLSTDPESFTAAPQIRPIRIVYSTGTDSKYTTFQEAIRDGKKFMIREKKKTMDPQHHNHEGI
jgi:hypothetical protein